MNQEILKLNQITEFFQQLEIRYSAWLHKRDNLDDFFVFGTNDLA